jgi:hypothetical protein
VAGAIAGISEIITFYPLGTFSSLYIETMNLAFESRAADVVSESNIVQSYTSGYKFGTG